MFAKAEVYGSGKTRMRDIIVKTNRNIDPIMENSHFSRWLARKKAFVKLPDNIRQFSRGGHGGSSRFLLSVVKSKFCLVQCYVIIPCCRLSVDVVEMTLLWARAKLNCIDDIQGILPHFTSCGLVSVESIRLRVYTVPAIDNINFHHETSGEKKGETFSDRCSDWKKEKFYLNSSFRDKNEAYLF